MLVLNLFAGNVDRLHGQGQKKCFFFQFDLIQFSPTKTYRHKSPNEDRNPKLPGMTSHVRLDADLLLTLFEATLLALTKVEDPATKASLMQKLVRIIEPEDGTGDYGPDSKVHDLLRDAGVFVCALNVLAGLVPTRDPRDEDQTDAVDSEAACSRIRAATDDSYRDNQASQAAANAAGLGPILIDLARAGPTEPIRMAAGAALIGMGLPVPP